MTENQTSALSTDDPTSASASAATSADPSLSASGELTGSAPYPRRWAALAVIAISQLMLVLDSSIMNIALPSAAKALDIAQNDMQWAITAYTLAFGGLLLLGGRVADYLGRRRTFVIGLLGFAAASAIGGFAVNAGMLFGARALQGAFGALLAPAALSLITVLFTESHERAKAFGVFGAISGGGAAIGLILGGVLTEYLGWEWCLLVNAPIAIIASVLAMRIIPESKAHGNTRLDVVGAILATTGLVALVYGFTEASRQVIGSDGAMATVGWTDPRVLGLLGFAAVVLVTFVITQTKVANPLLPLRVVLDRNRGGSYLIFLLVGAGMFSMFLFMGLYFQQVRGWSALHSGFAFLPFSLGIILTAGVAARLLPSFGPKPLLTVGLTMAAIGMLLLARTEPNSSYFGSILPAFVVMSIGMAFVFIPASSTALIGVGSHDAGVASALLNTAQQVGGSLGLALLNTFSISAITTALANSAADGKDVSSPSVIAQAAVHGYHIAYVGGAVLFTLALIAAVTIVTAGKHDLPAEGAVAAA